MVRTVIAWAVDRLPLWLWHHGNLYDVPGGSLHFCVESGDKHSVRSIEFARTRGRSHTIAMGLAKFPFDHPALEEEIETDDRWGLIAHWKAHRRQQRQI